MEENMFNLYKRVYEKADYEIKLNEIIQLYSIVNGEFQKSVSKFGVIKIREFLLQNLQNIFLNNKDNKNYVIRPVRNDIIRPLSFSYYPYYNNELNRISSNYQKYTSFDPNTQTGTISFQKLKDLIVENFIIYNFKLSIMNNKIGEASNKLYTNFQFSFNLNFFKDENIFQKLDYPFSPKVIPLELYKVIPLLNVDDILNVKFEFFKIVDDDLLYEKIKNYSLENRGIIYDQIDKYIKS